MARVRVATFNVENLFARFKFKSNVDPESAVKDGFTIDRTKFTIHKQDDKEITGALINEVDADVLCLQEVESQDVLKRFRNEHLGGHRNYPHVLVVDGNDPRRIDVALLSRLPIVHARSWQHVRAGGRTVFSRDCLEADVALPGGGTLTLYNNHFKSMIGGRSKTKARRASQTRAVRDIVKGRFGPRGGQTNHFIVCGDFNDYRGAGSGISALTDWREVQDVVRRLPQDQEWTHYWSGGDEYRQLDYLLFSDALARAHSGQRPIIWRAGLPHRASRHDGERFVGVGQSSPKASDHCPVSFDLDL